MKIFEKNSKGEPLQGYNAEREKMLQAIYEERHGQKDIQVSKKKLEDFACKEAPTEKKSEADEKAAEEALKQMKPVRVKEPA